MKTLLVFALSLFAVSVFAAAPIKAKAERTTFVNGITHTDATIVTWSANGQISQPAQSYEIQRKLFPFGWRAVGTANQTAQAWLDRKPAKRAAWYRVRIVFDGSKSPWSNKAYVDTLK